MSVALSSDDEPGDHFEGRLDWFSLSIVIYGVQPSIVSATFGAPDWSSDVVLARTQAKVVSKSESVVKYAHTLFWARKIKPIDSDRREIGVGINRLIEPFKNPPSDWLDLPSEARAVLSVGASIDRFNQGFEISPAVSLWLGERRVTLSLSLYSDAESEKDDI